MERRRISRSSDQTSETLRRRTVSTRWSFFGLQTPKDSAKLFLEFMIHCPIFWKPSKRITKKCQHPLYLLLLHSCKGCPSSMALPKILLFLLCCKCRLKALWLATTSRLAKRNSKQTSWISFYLLASSRNLAFPTTILETTTGKTCLNKASSNQRKHPNQHASMTFLSIAYCMKKGRGLTTL